MTGERVKIAGTEIPLTRWQARVVGALAVVGVAVLVATQAAKLPWLADADAVKLSPMEAAQLREIARHFSESPSAEFRMFDDARGKAMIRLYADECLAFTRTFADSTVPARSSWILGPGRSESTPVPTMAATDWTLSTPAYAGGPQCIEHGCLNPHPGRFSERVEEVDQCWLRVWRQWPDRCTHFAHFNRCDGTWTAPCWVQCVGH